MVKTGLETPDESPKEWSTADLYPFIPVINEVERQARMEEWRKNMESRRGEFEEMIGRIIGDQGERTEE